MAIVEIDKKSHKRRPFVRTALIAVGLVCGVSSLPYVPIYNSLENKIVNFFRDKALTESSRPELAKNIKIIAIDQEFAHFRKDNSPTLEEWKQLINAIASKNPSKILVDFTFDQLPQQSVLDPTAQKTKVAGKIFIEPPPPNQIDDRKSGQYTALEMRNEFYLKQYFAKEGRLSEKFASVAWMENIKPGSKLVGPEAPLSGELSFLGHTKFLDDGAVAPFIRLRRTQAIPHWGLAAADKIKLESDRINVQGKDVYLDWRNHIRYRTVSKREFNSRKIEVSSWLRPGFDSKELRITPPESFLNGIGPEDLILILDERHGDIDQHTIRLTSVVNAVIQQNWIRPVGHPTWAVALSTFAVMAIAVLITPVFAITLILAFCFFAVAVSWLLFVSYNIEVPMMLSVVSMLTTGLTITGWRFQRLRFRSMIFRSSMEGRVPPNRLKAMILNPRSVQFEPTGRIVTIMFVDIAGFSTLSETQTPATAMETMAIIVSELTDIVHKHDGVVDKIMGDSMVCFFGYQYSHEPPNSNHAAIALECALEIQRTFIARNIALAEAKKPFYSLRIGINSTSAYIGDLDTDWRIQPLLLGNGINYAKRLESVCRPYCVMLGGTARDMIGGLEQYQPAKKLIRVKNHEDPLEAYEVDAVTDQPESRRRVEALHRNQEGLRKREIRWVVPPDLHVSVSTEFGDGELANFSKSGLAILLQVYLAPGLRVTINLDCVDPAVREVLKSRGVTRLLGEIAWGRPFEERYIHGCKIVSMETAQDNTLEFTLREAISARSKFGEQALNQ